MTTDLDIARVELARAFERTPAATIGLWPRTLPALSEPDAREIWRSRALTARSTARAAMTRLGDYTLAEVIAWQEVFERVDAFEAAFAEAMRERAAITVEVAA